MKNIITIGLIILAILMGIVGYFKGKKSGSRSSPQIVKVTDTFIKTVYYPDTTRKGSKVDKPATITLYREKVRVDTFIQATWINGQLKPVVKVINGTPIFKPFITDPSRNLYPVDFHVNADTIKFTTMCDSCQEYITHTHYPNFKRLGYFYSKGQLKSYKYKPKQSEDSHNKNFILSSFVGYDPLNKNLAASIDGYYLFQNIGPKVRVQFENIPGTNQIVVKPQVGIQIDLN